MVVRKHLQVRLPVGLHAELVGSARAARRSLNSEIVWRLEALAEPGSGGNRAGLTAAGRTQGHGAEETEGPGRAGDAIRDPGSASALQDEWVESPNEPFEESP